MLKKEITFTDYNGNPRKETFWFNLNKAEITRMQLERAGGLDKKLEKISEKQDVPAIIETFRKLILDSYGEKSDDGRRFIKNAQLSKEFEETEAFSELFMELCTDAKAAADFVNGILPSDMGDAARAAIAEQFNIEK